MQLPGGTIIGGVGGRIYVGALGSDQKMASWYFDIARWTFASIYRNADCTHSGTWGAISRRQVAFDFQFTAEVPLDILNPPELLLYSGQSVAIKLMLADVTQDQSAFYSKAPQKYIFAPSALLDVAHTVLDATGRDVIRQQVQGSGNSLSFLLPDNESALNSYMTYLKSRKWLT